MFMIFGVLMRSFDVVDDAKVGDCKVLCNTRYLELTKFKDWKGDKANRANRGGRGCRLGE